MCRFDPAYGGRGHRPRARPGRENRSQFVITRIRGGREAIFWQTARTAKQARPNVSIPGARASGLVDLEIVVDSHERYAYSFSHQQATTRRAALTAGDYGLVDETGLIASVERKTLADLVSTLTSGKLKYLLGELASLPRGAVVVEDRYSQVFKLEFVKPSVVADGLAEAQVRWPNVPIVFCETRSLAEEWTFQFLGAAAVALAEERMSEAAADGLPAAGPLPSRDPTVPEVRRWALDQGYPVSDRGRIRAEIHEDYRRAHEALNNQPRSRGSFLDVDPVRRHCVVRVVIGRMTSRRVQSRWGWSRRASPTTVPSCGGPASNDPTTRDVPGVLPEPRGKPPDDPPTSSDQARRQEHGVTVSAPEQTGGTMSQTDSRTTLVEAPPDNRRPAD